MDKEAYKKMYLMYEDATDENELLKKRIEYLERSNNRREEIILKNRQEISDLEDEIIKLKEMQCTFLGTGCKRRRQQLEKVINEIREYIKSHISYEKNFDGYAEPYLSGYAIKGSLEILDKVKD